MWVQVGGEKRKRKLDNFLHPQKYFLFFTIAAIPLHRKPELRELTQILLLPASPRGALLSG
jgi:hypothetical protein